MTKREIQSLIAANEVAFGLPSGLLDRLVKLESGYNPAAYNSASGASGLTQIIKRYHPTVNDPFDPYESLAYAARMLRIWFDEFGQWESAVAAWHSGETAVRRARAQGRAVPGTVDSVTRLSTSNYVAQIVGSGSTSADNIASTDDGGSGWSWSTIAIAAGAGLLLLFLISDD